MEIYENITGIPSADNHTLELRYKLANTNDTFNVQVWDGSAWNTRGSNLDSTSWTDWSYTLLGSEVIGSAVQVRFIDVNPSSTPQDNILKDYLRVKSVTGPPSCGVDVTIENALLEGLQGQVLEYTIDVHNSGSIVDNFNLSYIPDGWPGITIVPLVLTDVMPSEHRQATMYVHVPDNAIECTYKEITVVAESQFCGATDNDSALAHATETPIIITYTYPSSYSAVKGTVTDFANQQSADDEGAYSTLAESPPAAEGWDNRATWPGTIGVTAACYAELSGVKYVYGFTGSLVYRYDIAANNWTNIANTGVATTSGLSVAWDRADKIYVISGGNTSTFYAFNLSTNTISTLATPGLTRYSNSGTTLAYDGGDNVYALLVDSGTPQSWIYAYSISGNSWSLVSGPNIPETIGTGGGLIRVGNYLYVASSIYSSQSGHFLRYDLVNSKWDWLASLPNSPTTFWGSGDGLENVGTNYIYANVGSSTQTGFFRYSISDNAWTSLGDTPGSQSNAGDRLASDGTYLYLVRAYTDSSFWRYTVASGGYNMEINETISSIPSADNYTLQLKYELANTNDSFNVQVWDGSAWNTRGDTLDSTSWTDWSYTLLSNEVISGTVQVRFVDVNPGSTEQDNILKDYLRVKGETLLAHCGVEVIMENALLEGYPSQVLEYTIDVYNSGSIVDNFNLSYIPDGWPDITIVPLVLTDVMPSEHRQATMYVHVPENAVPCTYKEITVVAESQFCGATDNDTTQAHVSDIPLYCGVDVTIENALLESYPSQVLEYTIDVHNAGNIMDNFSLSYIPDGWPDITIVPLVLTDVLPSEHGQATMFVHVPDNAIGCTYKEITVVAESQFCGATDNDNAIVHVIGGPEPWTGTATFSLVNIYTLKVDKNLDLNQGSKLVVKFYAYDNTTYENENVIETFVPPVHVEENENARHPGGTGVKKARLVLTTDDTSDLISTIASYTVRRVDLETRFSRIPGEWFLAPPPERTELETEFSRIPSAWFLAPS